MENNVGIEYVNRFLFDTRTLRSSAFTHTRLVHFSFRHFIFFATHSLVSWFSIRRRAFFQQIFICAHTHNLSQMCLHFSLSRQLTFNGMKWKASDAQPCNHRSVRYDVINGAKLFVDFCCFAQNSNFESKK